MKANYLLSGNDLSEGWGSQYSENPISLSCFLPEKFIKKLPPQAESSLRRGNSVNSTKSSDSSGSSFQGESSIQKQSKISNQGKLCNKRAKVNETSTTTSATAAPVPSHSSLNLASLEALQKSGAIEVIYPRKIQGNTVSSKSPPSTYSKN